MIPPEKRLGILGGFLIGNTLGAPFRAVKQGHIQQLTGEWVDDFLAEPILFPDRPEKNHLPGLHGIEGQEFLAVLAGATDDQSGQHPVARTAANLRDLAGTEERDHHNVGALRDPGRPLRHALARWGEQFPWEPHDHFTHGEPSEGASPAVRGLASVLLPEGEPVGYARLTHLRESSLVGAWLVAAAARLLSSGQDGKRIDAQEMLSELTEGSRALEDEMRDGELGRIWKEAGMGMPPARLSSAVATVGSLLRNGDDTLADQSLVKQAQEYAPEQPVTHVQHGFAPVLIPWVLFRGFGPMTPVQAIEDIVNRGGEAPLAAGLAGGLMGARYGFEQLPLGLLDGCLGWERARALLESPEPAVEEAWLASERTWTHEEDVLREPLREAAELRRQEAAQKRKRAQKKEQKASALSPQEAEDLGFAPPPRTWLGDIDADLPPWERKRLKAERGRRRIDWKEEQRQKQKNRQDD